MNRSGSGRSTVLLVFPYYIGHEGTGASGVKEVIAGIIAGADRGRFEFIVAAPAPGPFDSAFVSAGARMVYLGFGRHLVVRRLKNPLYYLSYSLLLVRCVLRLIAICRRERIDLVHSHSSAFLGAAFAARLLRIPHVTHVHEILDYLPPFVLRLYNRVIAALSDRVVIIASVLKPLFDFKAAGAPRVVTVFNGIDAGKFTPDRGGRAFREKFGVKNRHKVIGYLGRVAPKKGVHHLIAALPAVIERVPDSLLVIVGDADEPEDFPYRDSLHRLVESMNLGDRVIFTGSVRDSAAALASFDLLALASPTDTAPVSILEAMAMRKPVVAASRGGARDMVEHGVTGFIAEPRDEKAIAEAVVSILEDEELMTRFGAAARARVEKLFSHGVMARKTQALYEELLSR
ncbi:MAG: glycosyltransferase family 4 protein [bacterium]